jgi:hypothetical protein
MAGPPSTIKWRNRPTERGVQSARARRGEMRAAGQRSDGVAIKNRCPYARPGVWACTKKCPIIFAAGIEVGLQFGVRLDIWKAEPVAKLLIFPQPVRLA